METLIGMDIGSTSTKAVLFDLEGRQLAFSSSKPYQLISRRQGWVEQDPGEVWDAVIDTLKSLTDVIDVKSNPVKAISMAVQSGSLVPVNNRGIAINPIITWLDGRTKDIVKLWKASGVEENIKKITGWSLSPGLPLPTIAWLRDHDQDLFNTTSHYFSLNDYIVFLLTGKKVTNPSNAGGMQLLDLPTVEWSNELCDMVGITPGMLSQVKPSGIVIGKILSNICEAAGLNQDVTLINGAHDQVSTALGMGIINPGKVLLACGTAWVFTGISESPLIEELPLQLDINHHAYPDRWTVSQSLGGLGASLEWWLREAWSGINDEFPRKERFASLNIEIEKTIVNQALFFTPITGGHDDPATTRFGGFEGLQLRHTRADMARTIMESAGYELRWALETYGNFSTSLKSLSMVGGATNSTLWPMVLSDITGLPIEIPDYDNWPALGAAVLAGVGSGVYSDFDDALKYFTKPSKFIEPDNRNKGNYEKKYQYYRELIDQNN